MSRPSWDDYFMKITADVGERATCVKRQVGAVIIKDHRILSTGYNGAPKGFKHCTEETCIREQMHVPSGQRHELCRGLHAEQARVLNVTLAIDLARHSAKGWEDPALPDDLRAVENLLHVSHKAMLERLGLDAPETALAAR